jgi:hypothetical protein
VTINTRLGGGDENLYALLGGPLGDDRTSGRATGGGGIGAVARAAINISNTGSTSGGQGGGSGGSGGGGGGGGFCVAASAWLRADLIARDVRAGAEIDVLTDGLNSERIKVERVQFAMARCVQLIAESGATLVCSNDTPIEQADGSFVFAPYAVKKKASAVVEDENGMRWEKIVLVTVLPRTIRVARIHCGGRTYAAGDRPDRRIYTHNPIK